MNKLLTLTLLTFALIYSPQGRSQSQLQQPSQRERSVSIGVNGASNTTMLIETPGESFGLDYICGAGYGVGLFVNVPFAKQFSFQGEIQYDRFRAISGNNFTGGPSVHYTVSEAISVPLLIQYEFGKRRNMFLNFGPELRFNTRTFDRFYYRDWKRTTPYHYKSGAINPVSLAFDAGFGMRVPIAQRFDFLWELRLSADLTSLSTEVDYQGWAQDFYYGLRNGDNFRRINLAIRAGFAYRL